MYADDARAHIFAFPVIQQSDAIMMYLHLFHAFVNILAMQNAI